MNDSDKSLQEITSLVEAMLADADMPTTKPAPLDPILLAGELSARLADVEPGPPIGGSIPESKLAAYIDGGLDDGEQREVEALLAGSPACLHDIVAAIVYLDDLTAQRSSAPADLLESTIADSTEHRRVAVQQASIIPLRVPPVRGQGVKAGLLAESFQLLAAASDAGSQAIVCRSQSGIWTLEVFDGRSERNQETGRGYLLLTVHPDHRATYEGRTARVFVKVGTDERVLAEENVRNGEIYAEISLTGLDLRTKDAVNVVFGPAS